MAARGQGHPLGQGWVAPKAVLTILRSFAADNADVPGYADADISRSRYELTIRRSSSRMSFIFAVRRSSAAP